ncbi:hypothetical protein OC845_004162 [Tilletia horrida]|nr:hypothetical protein OC845_004162 [Tilletia horrida]
MRVTISIAALAAFVASSSAAALPERASCPSYNRIQCSGEYIVGKLYVRNPDNSLHLAAFAGSGKKLATKYNGTPVSSSAQFAIKRCSNANINRRDLEERQDHVITGFIVPNGHRNEALTLSSMSTVKDGEEYPLYADNLDVSCSNNLNTRQYFDLYVNQTASSTFYSLAWSGIPVGATPGGGYGPVSKSSNGGNIFISEKYTENGFNLEGFVNPFGYALELHP